MPRNGGFGYNVGGLPFSHANGRGDRITRNSRLPPTCNKLYTVDFSTFLRVFRCLLLRASAELLLARAGEAQPGTIKPRSWPNPSMCFCDSAKRDSGFVTSASKLHTISWSTPRPSQYPCESRAFHEPLQSTLSLWCYVNAKRRNVIPKLFYAPRKCWKGTPVVLTNSGVSCSLGNAFPPVILSGSIQKPSRNLRPQTVACVLH